MKNIFAVLALGLIMTLPIAASAQSKVCIKNSDGSIVLKRKCRGAFSPANLANINSAPLASANSSLTSALAADNHRFDSIPSGKTVTGIIAMDTESPDSDGDFRAFAHLPAIPSPTLSSNDVIVANIADVTCLGGGSCLSALETTVNSVCTGSTGVPTAPPGKVCIYIINLSAGRITQGSMFGFAVGNTGQGFGLGASAGEAGDVFFQAAWAYTSP